MITYRHQYITILIIIMCNSIFGMEYPQLQLEIPKEETNTIYCSAMIPDKSKLPFYSRPCVKYATKECHTNISYFANLQSTIKDPIILLHIQDSQDNTASDGQLVPLPAKLFINTTDGFIFRPCINNESDPLDIVAICTKNPNLPGNSFAEQFSNAMHEFYQKPGTPLATQETRHELENAEIITSQSDLADPNTLVARGLPVKLTIMTIFKHGPNGCPDEKTFIQSIIDDKTAPTRSPLILTASKDEVPITNKSYFRSLKNRELTGSFGR